MVVPTPGIDSISAWPRCRFTMPYTSASPSPVPVSALRREERLEGALAHFGRHADAGVADLER